MLESSWQTHEDPGPPRFTTDTFHLSDTGCEKATEGSGKRGCGEEDGCSNAEFASFVPAAGYVSVRLLALRSEAYER
jgi:hypothetical protein